MRLYSLVIETSRKCNIKCSHCLRGPSRRNTIDIHKLTSFLRSVEDIGTITIGGGEPSLALNQLYELKYAFINSNTDIGDIYLVTNGLYKTLELAEWFYDIYDCICTNKNVSQFTFSFDIWHDEAVYNRTDYREEHYYQIERFFEERGLYEIVQKHSSKDWNYQSIIKMGRAKDTGYKEIPFYSVELEDDLIQSPELYFTVNGEIYSSCNLSYKEMTPNSKFYIGKWNENLIDNIKRYNKQFQ